jgi:hypothetical protein
MTFKKNINQSRLINLNLHSTHPEVNVWVDAFWDRHLKQLFQDHMSKRGPKPKAKPKAMFRVLFLNLYTTWLEDPDLCLSFPRGENYYQVNSRYNTLHVSKKIIGMADQLLAQNFIDQWVGSEAARKYSRIWPLNSLVTYFETAEYAEFLIDNHTDRECIVLRGDVVEVDEDSEAVDESQANKKANRPGELEYEDKDVPFDIAASRQILKDYNDLLRRTHVDIGSLKKPVVTGAHYNRRLKRQETRRVSLRHDNKFVRRIFYRGDWALGGRYHGGWWQQIPSELRKNILINDQYTVEVDFSGFHISLAYSLEGHQPPDDPYELSVSIGGLDKKRQRKDVKLLALTAINAKDRGSAYSAFRDQRNRDQRTLQPAQKIRYTDKLLEALLDAFLSTNQQIAHYLCADKGVEMMNLDGEITTEIIKHFTDKGVPILTVHDSYIIKSSYQEELENLMQHTARAKTGNFDFKLKLDKLSTTKIQSFQNQDRQFNAYQAYKDVSESVIKTDEYEQRYQRFQRYLDSHCRK